MKGLLLIKGNGYTVNTVVTQPEGRAFKSSLPVNFRTRPPYVVATPFLRMTHIADPSIGEVQKDKYVWN